MRDRRDARSPLPGDYLVNEVAGTSGQWHVYVVADTRPDLWSGWFVGARTTQADAIELARADRASRRIWTHADPERRTARLLEERGVTDQPRL